MKESINRRNYERFLIDFMDGTLSKEVHAQVMLFLEQNPDLAEELDGLESFCIPDDTLICEDKTRLYKGIESPLLLNEENIEEYFIAYSEGELSKDEKVQVEIFVSQNTHLQADFIAFQNLKVSPLSNHPSMDKDLLQRIAISQTDFITISALDTLCIAYHENDISAQDEQLLLNAVAFSKEVKQVFDLHQKLIFTADQNIEFPNKFALKRKAVYGFTPFNQIFVPAMAAAFALLLMYYIVLPKPSERIDSLQNIPTTLDYTMVTPSEIIENAQDEEIPIEDDNNVVVSTQNKKIRSKNNSLVIANTLPNNERIPNNSIKMERIHVAPFNAISVVDSGYFMVVAPPDQTTFEKAMPRTVTKVGKKISRFFRNEKAAIEAETPQESMKNIAQLALNGFNKMTEGNLSIAALNPTDQVKDTE